MKIPQELLDQYGIKRTEIVFTNPKRVILRYHGGKDEVARMALSKISTWRFFV